MRYCTHCGREVDDEAVVCVGCGCPLNNNKKVTTEEDAPSGWLTVLGIFLPLVGFILYLVWKDETPLKAKSAGKGALIGLIVSVAIGILYGIIFASFISTVFYNLR